MLRNAITSVNPKFLYDPDFGSGGFLSQYIDRVGDRSGILSQANMRPGDVVPFPMSPMAVVIKKANQAFSFSRKAQEDVALNETERRALIKTRIGQGDFRTRLLSY